MTIYSPLNNRTMASKVTVPATGTTIANLDTGKFSIMQCNDPSKSQNGTVADYIDVVFVLTSGTMPAGTTATAYFYNGDTLVDTVASGALSSSTTRLVSSLTSAYIKYCDSVKVIVDYAQNTAYVVSVFVCAMQKSVDNVLTNENIISDIDFTVGAQNTATNTINLSLTMKDAHDAAITEKGTCVLYFSSDTAGASVTAMSAAGSVTATSGTIIITHTAKSIFTILTTTAGVFAADLVTTAHTTHYAQALANGKKWVSSAMTWV